MLVFIYFSLDLVVFLVCMICLEFMIVPYLSSLNLLPLHSSLGDIILIFSVTICYDICIELILNLLEF